MEQNKEEVIVETKESTEFDGYIVEKVSEKFYVICKKLDEQTNEYRIENEKTLELGEQVLQEFETMEEAKKFIDKTKKENDKVVEKEDKKDDKEEDKDEKKEDKKEDEDEKKKDEKKKKNADPSEPLPPKEEAPPQNDIKNEEAVETKPSYDQLLEKITALENTVKSLSEKDLDLEDHSDSVIGNKIIELLNLKMKNGRVDTTAGTKTPVGLWLTIKRILEEEGVKFK